MHHHHALHDPAAKLASILECLRELLSAENAQRRAVARAQGEIVHYRRAILYLGTETPAIFPLTSCGSDNRRKRDAVIPLSPDFHTAVDYCIRTIVSYGSQGRQLWLVPASSVY